MGNKLGKRRHVIDEKYTRPQGLYHHKDVDHKKLKKLILESKLAPCYPGDEECTCDLEECPICFLYYPSLNRSRCCVKGICTECFLQMKVPNSPRPTQCPFCKTSNYAVEYRGVKTKEEKGREQIEEQRVIEAKIRMRKQELLDDEQQMQKRQALDYVSRNTESAEVEENNSENGEGDDIVSSQDVCSVPTVRPVPPLRAHREDEFDLDLEDIMVIEAIWLSIQESGRNKTPTFSDAFSPGQQYSTTEDRYVSPSSMAAAPAAGPSSASPSGGLACAIAALAERQQTSGESPVNNEVTNGSTFNNMVPSASRFYNRVESPNYPLAVTSADISSDCGVALARDNREWNNLDHGSEVAEAGTSYASSATEDSGGSGSAALLPLPDQIEGEFRNGPAPEGYEEQMMLAMALSLAEARAIVHGPGVSWQ